MIDSRLYTLRDLCLIPVDSLPLSSTTLRVLKWHGIANVADCLMCYTRELHQFDLWPLTRTHRLLMYGEVFEALVAGGYWGVLERADVWERSKLVLSGRGFRAIRWQGKEQCLYEVPIETLQLSIRPYNHLRRVAITSVGDCVDFYWRMRCGDWMGCIRHFSEGDFDELEARLRALDYWDFIAEQYDV